MVNKNNSDYLLLTTVILNYLVIFISNCHRNSIVLILLEQTVIKHIGLNKIVNVNDIILHQIQERQ